MFAPSAERLLAGLNDAQRAAVSHRGGPLRVLAGPGTGKTTTLTHRVAHLVAGGVPAERILLLTFTRRAARQMLGRSQRLLESAAAAGAGAADAPAGMPAQSGRKVRGGTFHSVAFRTLRRHAPQVGLTAGFGVIDTADAADIIDLVRHDLGLSSCAGSRFPRKATLLDVYSRVVNSGQPLAQVVADTAAWAVDRSDDIAAVCKGYVERKRALGVLDFDDLLLHWQAALETTVGGRRLTEDVEHVLVDEYQDVNAVQVDIVRRLCANGAGLTVVGDDAQAIYGFRAADPRHILDFPDVFAGSSTVVLQESYRAGQRLLDVANAVAAAAPEGFTAVLRSVPGALDTGTPTLWRCHDEEAQARQVCDRALALREEGLCLRDQAVIVRASHASNVLELELTARSIPFVKYGGLRFLEAAHVKDLLAAFRLADNPRDELAWFRILQLLPGVGPAAARRAIAALGVVQGSASDAGEIFLRWPLAAHELLAAARAEADAVVAALAGRPGETTGAHAERVHAAMVPLVRAAYQDGGARLADLDAVVAAAAGSQHLSDVAADHVLEPAASTSDLAGPPLIDEDWLVITTAHSAKGLEWEAVHLLNASDGSWPSDMNLSSARGVEEERRVFYVALTRARRSLDVYLPQRYHHHPRARDDAHSWSQPSRFLPAARTGVLREVTVHEQPWGVSGQPPGAAAGGPGAAGTNVAVANAADLVAARLGALWG